MKQMTRLTTWFFLSFFVLLSTQPLCLSYNVVTMCTGGMPPTPQVVQIAGQKQNQQQYDPSKGPPVQNAASLHTPPPQLPGRLPQGALPMAGLPMALSQQAQLVENTTQPVGQLQAQVKVQAGGPVLATVNPHAQLQAQLQQQLQPGLHLQLQPQQQQSQAILQSGQVVSLSKQNNTVFMCVWLNDGASYYPCIFPLSLLHRRWHLLVPVRSRTSQFRGSWPTQYPWHPYHLLPSLLPLLFQPPTLQVHSAPLVLMSTQTPSPN